MGEVIFPTRIAGSRTCGARGSGELGGDLDSTGLPKRTLHVVVGQLAT